MEEYIKKMTKRIYNKYNSKYPNDEIMEILNLYYVQFNTKFNKSLGVPYVQYIKCNLKNIEKFFPAYYNYQNHNPYTKNTYNAITIIPTTLVINQLAEDTYHDGELQNMINNLGDAMLTNIFNLVIQGKTLVDIAGILGTSVRTIHKRTSYCRSVIKRYKNKEDITNELDKKILEIYLYCKA